MQFKSRKYQVFNNLLRVITKEQSLSSMTSMIVHLLPLFLKVSFLIQTEHLMEMDNYCVISVTR